MYIDSNMHFRKKRNSENNTESLRLLPICLQTFADNVKNKNQKTGCWKYSCPSCKKKYKFK